MLSRMKQKVALKLAGIIALSVVIASIAVIIFMARDSKGSLTEYLNISLSNAVNFSEFVYAQPLWLFDYDEVSRLNKVILKNELIVGVNVFDMKGFVKGAAKKDRENISDEKLVVSDLKAPYSPPESSTHIKKISGKIVRNEDVMGRYELFYSEKLIEDAVARFNNKLLTALILMGLFIILVVFLAVTNFNRPIIELAHIAERLAKTKDLSGTFKKKRRRDEIGILFNGVVDMIEQLKLKEEESQQLQMELEESLFRFTDYFTTLQEAVDTEDFSHRTVSLVLDDELSVALNKILETLETADIAKKDQNWLKDGQAELNNMIGGEQNISRLAGKAVGFIAEYAGAITGTIFALDQATAEFCLAGSYALTECELFEHRFKPGEGLTGQAVTEKRTIIIDNVPDNYMRIESSLFDVSPKTIIVIPLIYEGEVKGLLELGTMEIFTAIQIDFLESAAERLAVALNAGMFYEQLSSLLENQAMDAGSPGQT